MISPTFCGNISPNFISILQIESVIWWLNYVRMSEKYSLTYQITQIDMQNLPNKNEYKVVLPCIKGRPALWKMNLVFHILKHAVNYYFHNNNFQIRKALFLHRNYQKSNRSFSFIFFLLIIFQIPVIINKTFNTRWLISIFSPNFFFKKLENENKTFNFINGKKMKCLWLRYKCLYSLKSP